ncbi:hypothetical protein BNJ_00036 [Kaumoebavirus]|uniref:hypothetical protein n=1 Tax=Kaumoebavirus TaxID=1859492 RepID=UPI0009C27ADC|nr:hypothetical protein BNJ_00036 [Kaumoebavirus]ARA71879.1 hypothetical protein BNJ_00036 [Kaumoebavirus]
MLNSKNLNRVAEAKKPNAVAEAQKLNTVANAHPVSESSKLPEEEDTETNDLFEEDLEEFESDDSQPLGPFSPLAKDLHYYIPRHPRLSYILEFIEENQVLPDDQFDEKETYHEHFTRLFEIATKSLDLTKAATFSKVLKTLRQNSRE